MKRSFFFIALVSALFFASCADTVDDPGDAPAERNIKASELMVYSGGEQIDVAARSRSQYDPKSEIGFSIPDDGRYHVYYFVRIDNNIPGEDEINLPADQYFPRTSGNKSLISDANHGFIEANADWKVCKNFSKYIWSPDGSAIQSIIVEEPSIEQLLKADKGHNPDGSADNFDGLLANKDELHFLWYACKKQDADHVWHIDGILTSKDRTDISQTKYGQEITDNYNGKGMTPDYGDVKRKGHVEIDVHQQEHKDWNEIKTSIHLRDTVATEVFLPIGYQELADDFDIRVGEDYEYVTETLNTKVTIGEETFDIVASITHEEGGIRIHIEPNKAALKAARERYDDGITFEVHSYVTPEVTPSVIWDALKGTTYSVTPYTSVFGQITSAFYKEDEVKF